MPIELCDNFHNISRSYVRLLPNRTLEELKTLKQEYRLEQHVQQDMPYARAHDNQTQATAANNLKGLSPETDHFADKEIEGIVAHTTAGTALMASVLCKTSPPPGDHRLSLGP